MDTKTKLIIDSNNNYIKYLRYNSYWYKILIRNPEKINDFIKEVKEKYKLRTTDKIENVLDKMNMVSKFLDVLR